MPCDQPHEHLRTHNHQVAMNMWDRHKTEIANRGIERFHRHWWTGCAEETIVAQAQSRANDGMPWMSRSELLSCETQCADKCGAHGLIERDQNVSPHRIAEATTPQEQYISNHSLSGVEREFGATAQGSFNKYQKRGFKEVTTRVYKEFTKEVPEISY